MQGNNGSPFGRAMLYVAILFGLPIIGFLYVHTGGHIVTIHEAALILNAL